MRTVVGNPRTNPDDAFDAFMSMGDAEWRGLLASLFGGGVLTPAEQEGFDRALSARKLVGQETA